MNGPMFLFYKWSGNCCSHREGSSSSPSGTRPARRSKNWRASATTSSREVAASNGSASAARTVGVMFDLRAQAAMTLTGADQPAGQKDEHAAHDDLEDRREQRRVHIAFANPGNDRQFHGHDNERDGRREMKIADEIWHGMAQTAEGGHQAADSAAYPRCAATAEFAIVGQRFGKAHADAGPD